MRRIPSDQPATRREVALIELRRRPRDSSALAALTSGLIDLALYDKARVAVKRLDTLLRNDPYPLYVRRGLYHHAIGELTHAERWYRMAAAIEPAALVFLGAVLARQGRLAEALECHRRASRAPASERLAKDEAYFNCGLILRARRRYRDALRAFERAIDLDPKYALALEARADVRAAMKVTVPSDRSLHWRQMLDAKNPKPAVCHELARAYTKRYPEAWGGWIVLADVFAGFARYDEGIPALRRGVKFARSKVPRDFLQTQWGLFFQQRKDFTRAELWFRRAVTDQPSAANLTQLAEVLVIRGRFVPAKRLLARAIRIDSDDPSLAYYQLGLIARARRQYSEALRHFDTAIRYSPRFPFARVARRDVRQAMKLVTR